ncbi:hypothetical protein LPJ64_006115 [Coemansia asiatica]|uniref:Uncharacterized protein n=1 Tax=Coemansia asiatica TaxID=1052880 RepID=A0A9W8CFR1_9FUNG|nr:hypothetical protein LPJ64_006115 [Coemansia asiatica]
MPNIEAVYFQWGISGRSDTNQKSAKLLCDLATELLSGVRMVRFLQSERKPFAYIKLGPSVLANLTQYICYFNKNQPWLLDAVKRSAPTLRKLSVFFNGGKYLEHISIGMLGASSNNGTRYDIFETCHLDNLKTLILYQKRYSKYTKYRGIVSNKEIGFINDILDRSPSLYNLVYQRDAKNDSFLPRLLDNSAFTRIQRLDIGPTQLTLLQMSQAIQKTPQLQQLAYCPKPQDLDFNATLNDALEIFPLSNTFCKILINKVCCTHDCLTNVLFYLIVACPKLANISLVDQGGHQFIIRNLDNLVEKEPFSQYKDAVESICRKISDIKTRDDYNFTNPAFN